MRNALVAMIGLGLSACATTGPIGRVASPSPHTPSTQGVVVTDGANTDEIICERSFDAATTCPVLGTLNESEQKSLASFTQQSRVQSTEMQPQDSSQAPAPTMTQATDDQEF